MFCKTLAIKPSKSFVFLDVWEYGSNLEADVLENGYNMGEMDAMLLKKIEELTLYTIEQEKENEKQATLIKELLERMEKLESGN